MKKEGWDTICGFPVVSQPSSFEPCAFWLWQEHFQSQHLFFSFLFFYSRMTLRKKWRKYPKPILSSLLRNSPAFHSSTRLRLKRKSHFSQWLISLEIGSPGLPVSKTARGADALNVRVSRCFSAIRTDNRKLQTLGISLLDTTRLRFSLNTEIEIQSEPSEYPLTVCGLSSKLQPVLAFSECWKRLNTRARELCL